MNKLKYNVIVIFLVAIIGGLVYSSLFQDVAADNAIEIIEDVVIKEPDGEEVEEPKQLTPFVNGWQAFEYANNILQNGKGFYSETSQKVTVVGLPQTTTITRYRNDEGFALMETWCVGTISFFEGLYQHGDSVTNRKHKNNITSKVYPSSFNGDSRTLSLDAFTDERGWLPSVIPHVINKETAKLLEFSEKYDSTLKKEYYYVSFEFNDKANENYLKQVLYCADTNQGKINRVRMIFCIDKKTGYLLKTIKEEDYTINYMSIPVNCKSVSTEIYHVMNQRVVINKPAYM